MFGIGPLELVVILVVGLLVLGPKRMPELARTLGRGIGEFRRASNDLRQSLALDDLQNELRDGLSGANSILKSKPSDEDRPAQAGDDLAPGGGAAGDDAQEKPHPGELPLDNAFEHNPLEHNDSETGQATGSSNPADPSGTEVSSDSSDASQENAASKRSEGERLDPSTTRKTASAADSDLGNVPVGGGPVESDDERG
jgi:Tat protein translocase TatB subunit